MKNTPPEINSNLVKVDLQRFANETGLKVTIAHYPPYCSKYNPIEHLLFPHVTRACQGVVFETVEIVKELISKTKAAKGLRVTVDVIDKVYKTGRKLTADVIDAVNTTRDKVLPCGITLFLHDITEIRKYCGTRSLPVVQRVRDPERRHGNCARRHD